MLNFIEFPVYILIGSLAGFIGGLLGVGGGLIVVPTLVIMFNFLNFPKTHIMQMAVGTSLAAMILTSGASAWAHEKQKGVNWNYFKKIFPGVSLGAVFGSFIAHLIPTHQLQIIFGLFAVMIGFYFLFTARAEENRFHLTPSLLLMNFVGLLIGTLSSLMGIGGGIITVPFLTIFGAPLRSAISTSAVTGFLIALFGAVSFFFLGLKESTATGSLGYVYVPAFLLIGLTAMCTAGVGAKYAYSTSTHLLKHLFGILLIIVGINFVIFS